MTFIRPLVGGDVRQQRHRARALDRVRQLPLVPGAAARDAAGNDLAALRDEVAQPTNVLVIDELQLVRTELTDLAPPEAATLHRLRWTRNGSISSWLPVL